jgi:murein DD-endopeptidase MepM/ murein hydrolase activator NlpD
LDQGKRGPKRQRAEPDPLDLGQEPPLSADGGFVDRRRVSVQWFTGTVLTGLCGAALMGGAVYAALDGEATFAAVPERIEQALRGTLSGISERLAAARKSNRLPAASDISIARQIIRVSTNVRLADREVVRVRPFIRVAANLSLATSELSANIPPFNAQKLLADASPSGTTGADAAPDLEPDAEVSFVTRDLPAALPKAKIAALLPIEEILGRVRDVAEWSTGSVRTPIRAGLQGGTRLAYAAEGGLDPYVGFEARIVPENITLLAKTASQITGGNSWNERTAIAKKGDSVATVLRELGATPDEIKAITALLGPRGRDGGIKEGQKLRVLLAPGEPGQQRLQPIRVILLGESGIEAVVALSDIGKYVSVDVRHVDTEVAEAEEDEDDANAVRIYQSIYETGLRNQVPRPILDDVIRVFSYDVDFQRRVQPGDSFEVLFEDESGESKNDVLYTALTVGGETKRYFRFLAPDDNVVDYYDETGKSAKKFLVRKPVTDGLMRSGFGVRRHPILGYMKMHTGIDWAAPNGTPIYASGNGNIEKVGWESGYGKYVRIRHANGYQTAYGHMSAFARGMQPGVRVHQGQIIGYVGSTGLSTGPHLHYEIMVNGRFVDPMRIKLPRGRVLEGPILAGFDHERDRLETILSRAPGRVAQTSQSASR